MIFTEEKIYELRQSVKERLSEKRYIHTLGVEEMAVWLCGVFLPDKLDEIRIAALLHDIAKEIPYEEQISLLMASDLAFTKEDLDTKPALHSFSAVPLIKKSFTCFATNDVLSSVMNHTLGCPNMSLFDEIIFISDYTEQGRTYSSCIEVRNYLTSNISKERSYKENLYALHQASLMAIDNTTFSLIKRGEHINSRTLLTKKYFENFICN